MTSNYFQGTIQNPYHISIGAVVRNDRGEICCHYFEHFSHAGFGAFEHFYLLMRETIEPGETIEDCLSRGLREEFGIQAKLRSYIGSIVSHFPREHTEIEKTTLYFLCDLVSFDESQRKADDPEAGSAIVWLPLSALILKMKEQGARIGREDVDESAILERLVGYDMV